MSEQVDLSDITLELAKRHVESFRQKDAVMASHRQAMQCRDCEDLLDSGIRAYRWMRNAEVTLQEAARQGIQILADVVAAIKSLYHAWQRCCGPAPRIESAK